MQLLQHFKELTIKPKNAQELKGLILQLAIQGKLTANWRKENKEIESASELLKRIQKEKEQLVKSKKIKKEKTFPILDDKPFLNLPINWECSYLGDLGYAQTGTTPPTKNPDNYGSFIPFLGPANISNSSMEYPVEGLSEEGLKKGRLIEANSLMMVCIGGSMGKCNVNTKDVSCNQQINVLTTIYSPIEYIKIVCQSPYFQKEVWGRATGSATPMINKNKWLQIPISVPPLEEQKEIVNIVETLFKEVEQLEQLTLKRIGLKEDFITSALHQLTTNNAKQEWTFLQDHFKSFFNETTNIKKLRETVLQLAVQGKLTADWRANNLEMKSAFQSIQDAFDNQNKIESGRKRFLKNVDKVIYDDNSIPSNWVKSQFFNLCVLKRGHDLPKQDRIVGEYAVASSGGISGWHNEFKAERGVVIGRSGSTGKPHLIEDKHWPLNTVLYGEDYCGNFIDYVFIFLQAFDFSQYASSTAVPTLNRNKFLNELVIIPPVEEQKAIVEKVNALMGLCDALEQEVEQSQAQREMLMQSVLREVFDN